MTEQRVFQQFRSFPGIIQYRKSGCCRLRGQKLIMDKTYKDSIVDPGQRGEV